MIAIDGKTMRAPAQDAAAPHLVATFDHDSGTVLGQIAVAAKSNEIPAARDLLTTLLTRPSERSTSAFHLFPPRHSTT